MGRNRRGMNARGLHEFTPTQGLQRGMHRAFGKSRRFREQAQTRRHRRPIASCCSAIHVQINQVRRWLAVMADEIAHQDIEHVVIYGDRLTEAWHNRRKFSRYTDKRTVLSCGRSCSLLDANGERLLR